VVPGGESNAGLPHDRRGYWALATTRQRLFYCHLFTQLLLGSGSTCHSIFQDDSNARNVSESQL
jgi:4-diphosphocytidyl-2C-methyl-D-erythritol kinase